MAEPYRGFIWYELMTTDMDAALGFYRAVVGWSASEFGGSGMRYTVLSEGERGMGGVMELPEEACAAGARPGWIGYIGVPDVDAAVAGVKEAGGSVHRPPADIPDVGRFAIVADRGGATFALIAPSSSEAPPSTTPNTPGLVGWRELYAADGEASAFEFYSGQFGWSQTETMDMGGMGIYRIFGDDGVSVGAMMNKPADLPFGAWQFYFNVEGIDAAVERVNAQGGAVLMGPHEVPGGSWIIQGTDPQGAMFALVAPRR